METKYCIVSAHTGDHWYPRGQKRLRESLVKHQSKADPLFFAGEWPVDGYDRSLVYNLKASTIERATQLGYTKILWADSSMRAVQDIQPIWDIIDRDGYFFWPTGANAANTCTDKCLAYFGITRDTAESYPEVAGCLFGIDTENPIGHTYLQRWLQAARDGVFSGSWFHDGQSEDPRFLYSRHDQSAASVIAGTLGMNHGPDRNLVGYDEYGRPESAIFMNQGL